MSKYITRTATITRKVVQPTSEPTHLGADFASSAIPFLPELVVLTQCHLGALFIAYLLMAEEPATRSFCGTGSDTLLRRLGCTEMQLLQTRERLMTKGLISFEASSQGVTYRLQRRVIEQKLERLQVSQTL